MEGRSGGDEGWGESDDDESEEDDPLGVDKQTGKGGGSSRVGKWDSGTGRCAVTGRRVLGGTDGLRRVMV